MWSAVWNTLSQNLFRFYGGALALAIVAILAIVAVGPSPAHAGGPGELSGHPPARGGFSIMVWSGGSTQQLDAATPCPSANYFVTNNVGEFIPRVPGTRVAQVNAQWNTMFPLPPGSPPQAPASGGNIPRGTPIIVVCPTQ